VQSHPFSFWQMHAKFFPAEAISQKWKKMCLLNEKSGIYSVCQKRWPKSGICINNNYW